jgi:thiamine-phosphate pyrophosphorylase
MRVMVNDRVDVALAAQADGVHLKAASIGVADARCLAPADWIVGRSVHELAEVEAAAREGADYLLFGSIFATRSKPPGWPVAGLDGLRAAVAAARQVPVLAIGGVGVAEAAAVAATGAAGIAAIDAFQPSQHDFLEASVQEAVIRLRLAFDSTRSLS